MRHFRPFFVNFHGFDGDTDCPYVSNPGYVVYNIYAIALVMVALVDREGMKIAVEGELFV